MFVVLSVASLIILIYVLVPKCGNTNILIYMLICSILSAYTVMSCKGLSLGIKEIVNNKMTASYMYTLLFGLIALMLIVVQINYLNKSLDVFNTAIVTTVYYVLFSLLVMIASALLFKELANVSFKDFVGCICGFLTIICALLLIHFFKSNEHEEQFMTTFSKPINDHDVSNKISDNSFELIITNKSSNIDLIPDTELKNCGNPPNYFEHTTNVPVRIEDAKNDGKNFSIINYFNQNFKNLESKFKTSETFANYSYNKLNTHEGSVQSQTAISNKNFTFPQTSFKRNHTTTMEAKYRYMPVFDDSDQDEPLDKKEAKNPFNF